MLLSARALEVRLGDRPVLRGVDLEVSPGELVAVLGPNGAGKSTLLKACLGLCPRQGGEVVLQGRPLEAHGRRELARKIAWVPQHFEPDGGFTGLELVLMGLHPWQSGWALPGEAELARARQALAELGIAHLSGRRSEAMSGGERRLLVLARAFLQQPPLLFLDEPTAFLDVRHQLETLARVKARVAQGLGVLCVLHDVNLAGAFADRVVLLREGRVIAQGPTAEVLNGEHLRALYEVPMVAARTEDGQLLFAPRTG